MFGAAPENGPGTCPRDLGQAALHGLLETLYALHLPILEVSKLDG